MQRTTVAVHTGVQLVGNVRAMRACVGRVRRLVVLVGRDSVLDLVQYARHDERQRIL